MILIGLVPGLEGSRVSGGMGAVSPGTAPGQTSTTEPLESAAMAAAAQVTASKASGQIILISIPHYCCRAPLRKRHAASERAFAAERSGSLDEGGLIHCS